MDELLAYIAQNGIANVTDKQLPAHIREAMIQGDFAAATRVQNADTQGYELVLLTEREAHAATQSGFGLQRYAEAKHKYPRR
jgi:hypothetical protein